jgi:hypothetical protein
MNRTTMLATKNVAMVALLGVSAALLGTGCSGTRESAAFSPSYSSSSSSGYGGASRSTAPADGPASAAPATASNAGPAPMAPENRAGLGTEWGENRDSSINLVSFDRASPTTPFALATVRYNDSEGFRGLVSGHAEKARGLTVGGGAVTVVVQDSGGDPLEAVRKNGQLFVMGRAGERYSLLLKNNTRRRYEAVATVDGLDVMDGTSGSFSHRGYILPPSGEVVIDGFRKNENEVAAFRFGSVASSYAAQSGGGARDVGVIGVAFFREIGDDSENDDALRRTANPFPDQNRFANPPPGRD